MASSEGLSSPPPSKKKKALDSFGFPSEPTPIQSQRLRISQFTCVGQWNKYPTPESALRASASSLLDLAHSHGICPEYRKLLWNRAVSAVRVRKGALPLDYASIVSQASSVDPELGRQIELDLPRTFADQRDFAMAIAAKGDLFDGSRSTAYASAAAATEAPQVACAGDMHDALRRILRLFCVRNPKLGYLQSMNFVAAFLLLVFGRENEGDAFSCFEVLIVDILEGWYTQDMGMLRVDSQVVSRLINQRLVSLAAHMSLNLGFPDIASLFLPRWMLCIFLNCFPADFTVRVWDVVFMEALVEAEGVRKTIGGSGGSGSKEVVCRGDECSSTELALSVQGPSGAAPRFLVELCLGVMSSCAADIEACDNFPDAVDILKDVGSRVRDISELLALTRHPQCSLKCATMGVWRSQCAPELLRSALGLPPVTVINPNSSDVQHATLSPSSAPRPSPSPIILSPRKEAGKTPPPVPISKTLEKVLSPLSASQHAGGVLSPRFRSPLAIANPMGGSSFSSTSSSSSLQRPATDTAADGNSSSSSSFSILKLGDLVALASVINPSLSDSVNKFASAASLGKSRMLDGASHAPGQKPVIISASQKRSRDEQQTSAPTSIVTTSTATTNNSSTAVSQSTLKAPLTTTLASSFSSVVGKFAGDASRLAASFSSQLRASSKSIITAYSELDPECHPLPSSPTAQGAEAVKRARYSARVDDGDGEKCASASKALNAIELIQGRDGLVGSGRGRKAESMQLTLLSPPRFRRTEGV